MIDRKACAVVVALVAVAVCLTQTGAKGPQAQSDQPLPAPTWTEVAGGDRGAWGEAWPAVEEELLRSLDGELVDTNALLLEVRLVVQAVVDGDSGHYFDHAVGRRTFDRRQAEAVARVLERNGLIEEPADAALSDAELFGLLWSACRENGFQVTALAIDESTTGGGVVFGPGSDEWPYPNARIQDSLFVPPAGRVTQAQGDRLSQSGRLAHVCLRVRWHDGAPGHMRLHYFHDGTYWQPVSMAIASEARQGWPMPLF